MTGTDGTNGKGTTSGVAGHFGKQVRRDRLSHGWTIAELAQHTGINAAHVSRIESGKRPPTARIADALDRVFPERRGWYLQWRDDIRTAPEIPAEFRSWSDYEDQATTLRAWTPTIIDGLVQVADYAAAVIATEPGITSVTADARLQARVARQRRVLNREQPPRVTVLVDELSLFRLVGSVAVMAAQMRRLADAAAMPNVTIQVVPAIAHAGVASAYLLADDAVWCEHVAAGGVYTAPDIVSNVAARHDSLRAECYRASESLELFRELAGIWTTGVPRLTRQAAEGSA
jgi:transcriptional regulator with XRE-family HTH domain